VRTGEDVPVGCGPFGDTCEGVDGDRSFGVRLTDLGDESVRVEGVETEHEGLPAHSSGSIFDFRVVGDGHERGVGACGEDHRMHPHGDRDVARSEDRHAFGGGVAPTDDGGAVPAPHPGDHSERSDGVVLVTVRR
jgi:hypothetical protein